MSSSRILCFLCTSFAGRSFADVVRHIGYVHACDPHFFVTCGLHGCKQQYRSYSGYRKHLYKAHADVMKGGLVPEVSTPLPSTSVNACDADDISDNYASEEGKQLLNYNNL